MSKNSDQITSLHVSIRLVVKLINRKSPTRANPAGYGAVFVMTRNADHTGAR